MSSAPDLIANDPAMEEVVRRVEKVLNVDSTVLIQGESGTGKTFLAYYIHNNSGRRERPFVRIDCTTIPSELLESELFGYEKGAFTDAKGRKEGKFEQGDGGTVFIDRIPELPFEIQSKLLRIIEEKSFERLGGKETVNIDVRIICSAGTGLWEKVEENEFREDLFYRLNVVPIELPPLRERKKDIIPFARYFLDKHSGRGSFSFTEKSRKLLKEHTWRGNLRELENTVQRALVVCEGEEIGPEDLQISSDIDRETFLERARTGLMSLEELEREYIENILDYTGGHKSKAAEILGISRKTLWMKRKKYGMD